MLYLLTFSIFWHLKGRISCCCLFQIYELQQHLLLLPLLLFQVLDMLYLVLFSTLLRNFLLYQFLDWTLWFSNFIILISLKSSRVNLFLRAVMLSPKTSLVASGRVGKYRKASPFKCNCKKFACCAAAIVATPIAPVISCSNWLKLSVSDPEKGVMLICACAILLFTRLDYILNVQSVLLSF